MIKGLGVPGFSIARYVYGRRAGRFETPRRINIAYYFIMYSPLFMICWLMKFSRKTSAGYLANHLARLFALGLQKRIKPLGLSTGIFPIMLQLWEEDGMTQKELVDRLGIEQATVANSLSRMERDGLIRRCRDDHDGRITRSWLTDQGRTLRAPAIRAATEQNAEALAGLSEQERRRLITLLAKAIDVFEKPPSDRS